MTTIDEDISTALLLDPRDNVVIVLRETMDGDVPRLVGSVAPPARETIPRFHKMARVDIPAGGDIVKYGQTIGIATSAIATGAHVHLHNAEGFVGRELREGKQP